MFSRSDSRSTMSISCSCSLLSGSSWRRIWIEPDIDASGLRISCAMPAAISPTAASRCWIARVALELLDVGDVLEREEKPGAAARRLEVRRAQADLDLAAAVGRAVAELVAPRALRRAGRSESTSITGAGSCSTSSIGRPTAARNGTPVIVSAPRLNVRIRCDGSVVARPLGRLSMTCWFSACRSAISVDACFEPRARRPQAVGQRAAEQRDGEEAEHVQRDGVPRHRRRRQRQRVAARATDRSAARTPPGTAPARGRRRARR